jgi:hypothetical protein
MWNLALGMIEFASFSSSCCVYLYLAYVVGFAGIAPGGAAHYAECYGMLCIAATGLGLLFLGAAAYGSARPRRRGTIPHIKG